MAPEVENAVGYTSYSGAMGEAADYCYDAELAAVLPFNVKIPFENVAEARRVEAEASPSDCENTGLNCPDDPNVVVEDHVLPGADGGSTSPSGPILPLARVNRLGALVFFHGGGYVLGNLDNEQLRCIHFANKVNCVVVSPDYRLARITHSRLPWMIATGRSAGWPKRDTVSGSTTGG